MEKSTKVCDLTIYLKMGIRISGTFHIPLGTSSAIRPSDAIAKMDTGFLTLSSAVVEDEDGRREHPAMLIRLDAISHIDLPTKGWVNRIVDETQLDLASRMGLKRPGKDA